MKSEVRHMYMYPKIYKREFNFFQALKKSNLVLNRTSLLIKVNISGFKRTHISWQWFYLQELLYLLDDQGS